MQRRTTTRLCAASSSGNNAGGITTANHYRASHTRYINPSDMGLAAGNRFDPIFAATALRTATFAQSPAASAAASQAFSSLPEMSEFLTQFTVGNTALHTPLSGAVNNGSGNNEHRHHGLDAAYSAICRAEEIFTSLIEHQLSEKTAMSAASSSGAAAASNGKVSAHAVSDDIKLQFATIAATKISLLTNHFNHLGSGSSHASASTGAAAASGAGRAPFTNISHPVMSGRSRIKVETEVLLTAIKALSLFETPQAIAVKTDDTKKKAASAEGLGPKAAAMFPFLKEADAAVTGGDVKNAGGSDLPTTDRDAPTHTGRSELADRLADLIKDAQSGGFLSGKLTRQTAASSQLLDTMSYILTTMTYSLAKLKEIAPDAPLHFNGAQWSVFGEKSSDLSKAEKAARDAMLNDSPKYFNLVQSFRITDANWLLRDVIRTYLNMGGHQNAVEAHLPELTYAAASVVNVLRSSCQQTASRLCVTSGLLRILLDGNLVEAQKDILRGRKLLTVAHNNGREESLQSTATAVAGNPALQAQQANASAHAILGQQLMACPISLLIGEFGQSLAFGDDAHIGQGSALEGGLDVAPTGSVGVGNRNYGRMVGNDFSSVRHLHNRVNLFSMMSKSDANKRPVEGGLFLSMNAEILARKSYGTYEANQVDGPLVDLYNDSVDYYATRVEEGAKADDLALNASTVMSTEQKALLREQRAAEQDHFASTLYAAGNFFLAGTPRPPPATNKQQDTRIWDQPHTQLAYLQSPLISAMAGSDQLFTESVRGSVGGGHNPNDMPFDLALKKAQQLLEKALQLTRTADSSSAYAVTNDAASIDSGSSVYNLKAAYILRSLACVYCEMKDYLYATGLFASAERAFVHHYGQHSAEVLDLLALQETYQRRIGATREGEMTFKKMMGVVNERRKYGVL